MMNIRPAEKRGTTQMDWLDSHHSFSFGRFRDPRHMGFGKLRVINDDVVAPGAGFGEHPHRDMEIITYVVDGALEHADSLGNGSVIRPGDVQIMSAGTGIRHSEFNASDEERCRLLQIWLPPNKVGLPPRYDQKRFPIADKTGELHLVLHPEGKDEALTIHQDARIYAGRFHGDESATLSLDEDRRAWVQVVRGTLSVNGQEMSRGDGAGLTEESELELCDGDGAEVLVFDLA